MRRTIALTFGILGLALSAMPATAQYWDERYPCGRPGWTVQDGVCKPYRGPVTYDGGYRRYRLPCGRPGWTVQDGVCKPYTGR